MKGLPGKYLSRMRDAGHLEFSKKPIIFFEKIWNGRRDGYIFATRYER